MPASQKSRSLVVMLASISLSTCVSQPARASGSRFLQTSQTEDESAAEASERVRASR